MGLGRLRDPTNEKTRGNSLKTSGCLNVARVFEMAFMICLQSDSPEKDICSITKSSKICNSEVTLQYLISVVILPPSGHARNFLLQLPASEF